MATEYKVAVMKTPVAGEPSGDFGAIVDEAAARVEHALAEIMSLQIDVFEFAGPQLSPQAGAYSPLDFLQLGLAEKLERRFHFLLVVTEVDLSASTLSYVLALPSQLTNVGILSARRLSPSFWGHEADRAIMIQRLTALMLHTIGHLLNISHSEDKQNAMYDFREVGDLDRMEGITAEQIAAMQRNLPVEAREQVAYEQQWWFAAKQIFKDWRGIWHAVVRANPLRLATRLPTMLAAALSVNIVLFFSAETWDVGGSFELWQLLAFSLLALLAATFLLYHAFSLAAVVDRNEMLSESTVVTQAATLVTLLLTMIVLYVAFFAFFYVAAVTVFPQKLMSTWPTVDPVVEARGHAKLSMFLAAMGVLAGSLGGRADSKTLIRHILFIDEET